MFHPGDGKLKTLRKGFSDMRQSKYESIQDTMSCSSSRHGDWGWLYADESEGGASIPVAVMPSFPPSKDSTYDRDGRIRRRVIEDVNVENVKSDGRDVNAESSNALEPMALPKSTHTLLFSEPICSFPFVFAMVIALVCLSCLSLALVNNLFKEASGGWNGDNLARGIVDSIPANVTQYAHHSTLQY